ncbi:histidine kinase dimerization/phosphoacceptor domain-containing protein, partial [Escherichia coli]|nr:histidine kinase dimerization/phosphoacceptor domain-containing protein [Escherichia coli]
SGMFAWGLYLGSRRELLWTLRDRAERAESEQQLRASTARDAERARIAREMHDVLAHRISQVSMHAGALAFREDLTAEQMRTSAAVIQAKANEALTDLRAVLGVLREQETGRPVEPPQPTYGDIPALVADAREEGMSIEFTDDLPPGT